MYMKGNSGGGSLRGKRYLRISIYSGILISCPSDGHGDNRLGFHGSGREVLGRGSLHVIANGGKGNLKGGIN